MSTSFDLGILPVGKYCDLACRGCFQRGKAPGRFITINSALIDYLEDIKFTQCFIGGGEPFLHDDLEAILSRLSQKFCIKYILTHGYGLLEHLYLRKYVKTVVVSIDLMHKRAMQNKYRNILYPNDLFSWVESDTWRSEIRVNSVISCSEDLSFLYEVARYIARSRKVKGWNVYRNVESRMPNNEYHRIIKSLNESFPLSFKIEEKTLSTSFVQILVFPDFSIESYSFDECGVLARRTHQDIMAFDSQEALLLEIGTAHGKRGAFVQIHEGGAK